MVVYLLKKTQSQSGWNVTTSVEVIKLSLSSCLILCVSKQILSWLGGQQGGEKFKTLKQMASSLLSSIHLIRIVALKLNTYWHSSEKKQDHTK